MSNEPIRICLADNCTKTVAGRPERLFCSDGCRFAHHNKLKTAETRLTSRIANTLKKNRRILSHLLGDKQSTSVPEIRLREKGYNFLYHTHSHHAKKSGKDYVFCFDLGYHVLDDGYYLIVRSFQTELHSP